MTAPEAGLVLLLAVAWWAPVAAVVGIRRWQRARRRAWTLTALADARQRVAERLAPRAVPLTIPPKARIVVAPRPARANRVIEELGLLETQSAALQADIGRGLSLSEIANRVTLLHAHHRHVRALLGEGRPLRAEPRG